MALESVHLTRDTRGMCVVRVNGRLAIRDNGDIIDHMATLEWFAAPPAAVSAAKDAEIAALRAGSPLCNVPSFDTGASAILEAGRLRAEVAGLRAELLSRWPTTLRSGRVKGAGGRAANGLPTGIVFARRDALQPPAPH